MSACRASARYFSMRARHTRMLHRNSIFLVARGAARQTKYHHTQQAMSVVRASLLGAVDGAITSFAIVAGANALTSSRSTVLVVGSSSLLADGVSMGVSEYLSSASEKAAEKKTSARPVVQGALCLTSFVMAGVVPLGAYLASESLLAASAIFLLELMALGGARTALSGEPLFVGLAQTTLLGAFAGSVALGVGWLSAQFL